MRLRRLRTGVGTIILAATLLGGHAEREWMALGAAC